MNRSSNPATEKRAVQEPCSIRIYSRVLETELWILSDDLPGRVDVGGLPWLTFAEVAALRDLDDDAKRAACRVRWSTGGRIVDAPRKIDLRRNGGRRHEERRCRF